MAAPTPRKPRRTKGRHRKPAKPTNWLGVGAVGVGLAAALVTGQGVAAADTADSSTSQDDSSGAGTDSGGETEAGEPADAPSISAGADDDDTDDDIDPDDDTDFGDDTDTDLDDDTDTDLGDDTDLDDNTDTEAVTDDGADAELEPLEEADDPEIAPAFAQPNAIDESAVELSSPQPFSDETSVAEEPPPPVDDSTDLIVIEEANSDDTADVSGALNDSDGPTTATESDNPDEEADNAELEAAVTEMSRELLRQLGITPDGNSAPTSPVGMLLQALWVSARRNEDPFIALARAVGPVAEMVGEAVLAEVSRSIGWIPGVGTVMYGVSAIFNASALVAAVVRGDQDDIFDEIHDLARDFVGMIPIVGAPLAADMYGGINAASGMAALFGVPGSTPFRALAAAPMGALAAGVPLAAPAPGTAEWYFQGVLALAVKRLAGWPGGPWNFTDFTNRQTDWTLDLANDQLEAVLAGAAPGSPARWVPDLQGILGLFFVSAIPGYTFVDTLNAMGDFLNRVAPPFTIAPGAGTFGVITPYKMMGAAVVGTATVLKNMLNGVYDPVLIEIDIIKATTGAVVTEADLNDFDSLLAKVAAAQTAAILGLGDGGAFHEPERAWDVILPAWTPQQVNPFTLVTYVGLVAVYKRFQEMAVLLKFDTWTTYDSWLYTINLGSVNSQSQYAAGTFHVEDDFGRDVTWFGVSQGGTYVSEGGALVTINTSNGGFTYTNTLPGAAFFHKATSENEADRYDIVYIPVESADGVRYTLPFKILIIDGTNANPTTSAPTVGAPDALGVVRGKINASDSDGDTLTYTLVGSSVNGLDGNSAYTKNGSGGNGGIVTINATTGDFTYVSSATADATQSFQVRVGDGHHGSATVTVTVTNVTTINPANVTKPAQYIVTGSVPIPPADAGIFTGFSLGTPPAKGIIATFNPNTGAFTYIRDSSLGHSTTADDVVTIIGTDANGRTVTLRLNVQPDVPNTAPTLTLTQAPTVGTLSGTTQTSTGKLTYSDADGDAPIWPTSVTSSRGATVTIAADGTFTYTSNLSIAQRHAAARIGAAGSTYNGVNLTAYQDAFTMTVADGFGGTAQLTVVVPIYAINSSPSLGLGPLVCAFTSCTITITTTDPDGDDLSGGLNTSNNGNGDPWYTLERGSVTVNAGNQHTMTWGGNTNGLGTQQTGDQRYTVYDGHYRVTNGVVDTSYFARAWVDWHDTTRTMGN
ncbi:Ig-like domain-containing protein [Mycolicibacterium pulveris]|uniref:Ig-like domain-containing protein n=1 Tax=Mycolicibacterium pulveris TaxID=36813 RepID=UPI003CE8BAE2